MKLSTVLATSAVVLGLLVPAGAAQATTHDIHCGDTITTDVTLTHDLHCTGEVGLTVAAGVTLDLGGYSLVGSEEAGTGILIATAEALTLRNGTVSGWTIGFGTGSDDGLSTPVAVDAVTFAHNQKAIFAWFTSFAITSSTFVDNDEAINGVTVNVTIDRSRFMNNDFGVGLGNGSWLTIDRSTFTENRIVLSCSEASFTVTHSTFRDNHQVAGSDFCEHSFRDNAFSGNDLVYRSSSYGEATDEFTRNRFIRNGDVIVAALGAHLRDNIFISNKIGVRAIDPEIFDPRMTLERNVFIKNTDAVYITMPSQLKNNVAVRNSGYGIYAPDATDLGGNIAFGNGISPQCTGVTCRPR
jgi:hypothetical protein